MYDWNLESFKERNSDLPTVAEGVFVEFQRDPQLGYISLCLVLDDETTLDDIRNFWWAIAEWKRRLLAYQGPTVNRGFLCARMNKWHKNGDSYRTIASRLNDEIVKNLRNYLTDKTWQDLFGLAAAEWLLLDLGMPEEEAKIWCDEILKNLEAGQPPFLPDGGPVTPERVRECLRTWRRRPGVGKIG